MAYNSTPAAELSRVELIDRISSQAAAALGGSVYTIYNRANVAIGVGYRNTRLYFWSDIEPPDTPDGLPQVTYEEYGDPAADPETDQPLCFWRDSPAEAITRAVQLLENAR